ncbi:MazG nucleotide pyrophosphohydrolase domain-containing protein [Patescibacteria group bacterium]
MKEILKFIDIQNERLRISHEKHLDEKTRTLAKMVKLSEEIGELADEVLSFNLMQRDDKIEKHSLESVSGEVADVLITTLLLAKIMKVDVEDALQKKIEHLNKRLENV